MNDSLKIKKNLDMILSWGYKDSEEVEGGFIFSVVTSSGQGKIFVAKGDDFSVTLTIEALGTELSINGVPEEELVDVIDGMIKGRLTQLECDKLSREWEKKADYQFFGKEFSDFYCNVISNGVCYKPVGNKGIIITNGNNDEKMEFVKNHLKIETLRKAGKVKEITIDNSWKPSLENGSYWSKICAAAYQANNGHGLLVININTVEIFSKHELLRKLAKQEYPLPMDEDQFEQFRCCVESETGVGITKEKIKEFSGGNPYQLNFDGYVILVLNVAWKDVKEYDNMNSDGYGISEIRRFYSVF